MRLYLLELYRTQKSRTRIEYEHWGSNPNRTRIEPVSNPFKNWLRIQKKGLSNPVFTTKKGSNLESQNCINWARFNKVHISIPFQMKITGRLLFLKKKRKSQQQNFFFVEKEGKRTKNAQNVGM